MKSIGNYAFNKSSSLKEITIPSSVTEIRSFAFEGCTSLMKITFNKYSSVSVIGHFAYAECSSLNELSIPTSVAEINTDK